MWRNHPFNKRNRTMERTMGVGVGGDKEVEGNFGQNLEKSEREAI